MPLGFEVDETGLSWTEAPYARQDMPARCAAEEAIRIALQRQPMRYTDLRVALGEQGLSETSLRRVLREVAVKGKDGRWGLVCTSAD